jgi:hypothetical protein
MEQRTPTAGERPSQRQPVPFGPTSHQSLTRSIRNQRIGGRRRLRQRNTALRGVKVCLWFSLVAPGRRVSGFRTENKKSGQSPRMPCHRENPGAVTAKAPRPWLWLLSTLGRHHRAITIRRRRAVAGCEFPLLTAALAVPRRARELTRRARAQLAARANTVLTYPLAASILIFGAGVIGRAHFRRISLLIQDLKLALE